MLNLKIYMVIAHIISFIIMSIAAVMHSDGFEYLKKNCPLLQSELLKTGVGCEKEFS